MSEMTITPEHVEALAEYILKCEDDAFRRGMLTAINATDAANDIPDTESGRFEWALQRGTLTEDEISRFQGAAPGVFDAWVAEELESCYPGMTAALEASLSSQ